ncbi:MAG TPA: nucleotidyltransferase domain-containing protein [Blastocatellia bacterium]|nr:nucleotidyltransferase domain-containing protein [Blastocatellia bacterium]
MNERIKTIVTEFRQRLRQLYGERLEQVILFGSQVRDGAVEGSDIDVMIVLKGEVKVGEEISRCSEFTAELCLEHDVLIQKVFMSSERFAESASGLLENVRREGILITG